MDILEEIVVHKKSEIKDLKEEYRKLTPDLRPREVIPFPPPNPFLIAEIKAASPSAGKIISNIDPVKIYEHYIRGGADAISVVVDRRYFSGDPCWIREIASRTEVPVLFKEFVIDEWQVEFAYNLGADIVLLIATILTEKALKKLYSIVKNFGMEAIIETHDSNDIEKALNVNPGVIGINNRNLKNFKVDITTTLSLIEKIPREITVVSESGIFNPEDIKILRKSGVKGFLVGTSILKSGNLEEKVRELKNAVMD